MKKLLLIAICTIFCGYNIIGMDSKIKKEEQMNGSFVSFTTSLDDDYKLTVIKFRDTFSGYIATRTSGFPIKVKQLDQVKAKKKFYKLQKKYNAQK